MTVIDASIISITFAKRSMQNQGPRKHMKRQEENDVQVQSGGGLGCEWTMWKLPDSLFNYVKKQIAVAASDKRDYKQKLLGHISGSYHLEDPDGALLDHVLRTVKNHSQAFDNLIQNTLTYSGLETHRVKVDGEFTLDDLWVNYQKKHEFNPLHNHGGILSFVIWVQIPFDLKDEVALEFGKNSIAKESLASKFQFVFPGANGELAQVNIPVSKDYEGVICVFPSFLMHQVFPFYSSDEDRISVAGNIRLKISAAAA